MQSAASHMSCRLYRPAHNGISYQDHLEALKASVIDKRNALRYYGLTFTETQNPWLWADSGPVWGAANKRREPARVSRDTLRRFFFARKGGEPWRGRET
jgi:hypothetical protein